MNELLRDLAPISATAWSAIEAEARSTLRSMLAGRRLVDFKGPLGWCTSAVELGRVQRLGAAPQQGVEARLRKVQPLVEIRVPFELSREELEAIGRGARDVDLDPVRDAARLAALTEDAAIFHGFRDAGIEGMAQAGEPRQCALSGDYTAYPGVVAEALHKLRSAGISGPYAIALGPRCFTGLSKTTIGGYPAMQHVRRMLDGPIISAPAVDGAIVLTTRGGDFELTCGQDFSIGYLDHSATAMRFYVQESFTFRVLTPEAAVPLAYSAS